MRHHPVLTVVALFFLIASEGKSGEPEILPSATVQLDQLGTYVLYKDSDPSEHTLYVQPSNLQIARYPDGKPKVKIVMVRDFVSDQSGGPKTTAWGHIVISANRISDTTSRTRSFQPFAPNSMRYTRNSRRGNCPAWAFGPEAVNWESRSWNRRFRVHLSGQRARLGFPTVFQPSSVRSSQLKSLLPKNRRRSSVRPSWLATRRQPNSR